jgi:DNA-directed RNA polymerase
MRHTDEDGKTHTQVAAAWYHTYAYVLGKKVGMIKPNKFVAERLSTSSAVIRVVTTKLAPMLVPPKKWSSWDEGGYWYTREEVMRTRQSLEQKAYLKEASDSNQLSEVYHGLDILGETCWTINRKLFDIILKVWNSGESIADIPPQASELQYPSEETSETWDVKTRMNWIQECKFMSRTMQNAHSVRCDINYKLEIARAVCPPNTITNVSSLVKSYIFLTVSTSAGEHILYRPISTISETICAVDFYFSTKVNHWVHKDFDGLKSILPMFTVWTR